MWSVHLQKGSTPLAKYCNLMMCKGYPLVNNVRLMGFHSSSRILKKANKPKQVTSQIRQHQKRLSEGREKKSPFFKHHESMHDQRDNVYTKSSIRAAVMDKNIPYLEECLRNNKSLKDREENILSVASHYRGRALVSELLNKGANPNWRNKLAMTPLHYSCLSNDRDITLLLLQHGANPTIEDEQGLQPIHKAAYVNSHRCLALLLGGGADPNALDTDEETPLHIAATHGGFRSCQLLLKKGALVNAQHREGGTPLHHGAYGGHANIVKLLLGAGALPSIRDSQGLLAVHRTCQRKGNRGCVEQLVHAAPNTMDDTDNESGMSPLHFASYSGNIAAVNYLLRAGAMVDAQGPDGWTPFMLASQSGDISTISLLLQYGATSITTNKAGMTGLHVVPTGAAARLLIDAGIDVNCTDDFGTTPLHAAGQRGDTDVASCLIECGALVDVVSEVGGGTPLHMAAVSESPELVQLLVDRGANIDQQTESGDTPLHLAIMAEDPTTAAVLIDNNARIDIPREDGQTPLDLIHDPQLAKMLYKALPRDNNTKDNESNSNQGAL